jgi:hypothetical protein
MLDTTCNGNNSSKIGKDARKAWCAVFPHAGNGRSTRGGRRRPTCERHCTFFSDIRARVCCFVTPASVPSPVWLRGARLRRSRPPGCPHRMRFSMWSNSLSMDAFLTVGAGVVHDEDCNQRVNVEMSSLVAGVEMVLKRPKQGPPSFKAKEMLVISTLSPPAAEKFTKAIQLAATKVRYTGSPYHRSPGSKTGTIAHRVGLTSRCPRSWTNVEATRVLRLAIKDGRVSMAWENGYPRYVWHLDGDVLYEARLTNNESGEYHGYPLEDRWQWPKNFR